MGDLSTTDWPGEYSELKEIDTLLRCPICYEYIETAMMIPNCSHNYCSLCIRRYIQYKNKCPQCSIVATEPDLKNNRTVDEILRLFSSVRSKLLQLMLNHKEVGRNTAEIRHSSSGSVKSVLQNKASPNGLKVEVTSHRENKVERINRKTRKRRKISATSSDSDRDSDADVIFCNLPVAPQQNKKCIDSDRNSDVDVAPQQNKKCKDSDRDSDADVIFCNLPVAPKQNKKSNDEDFLPDIEINSPPADFTLFKDVHTSPKSHDNKQDVQAKSTAPRSENNPVTNLQSPKATTRLSPFFTSAASSPMPGTSGLHKDRDQKSTPGKSPQIVKVSCPVCSVEVPQKNINLHLDRCLNGPPKREPEKAKRKRMPNLVYALMKDAELKKKLSELGLSNAGDRKTLIKRHHEYTLLYNVECDSLNPKPVKEIIKELEKAEKNKNKPINNGLLKGKLTIEKGASSNTVDKAQKEYVTEHKNQFKDLIASVKARMKKKKEAEKEKTEKETVSKSPGAASDVEKATENCVHGEYHDEVQDIRDSENLKTRDKSNEERTIPDVHCIHEDSNNRIINTNIENDSANNIPLMLGEDSFPSIPGYSPDVSTNSQRSDSTQESKSLIETVNTSCALKQKEMLESTTKNTEEVTENADRTIETEGSVDNLEELMPSATNSKYTSSQESTDIESLSSLLNSDDETSDFIPDSPVETNHRIVRRSLRQKPEKKEPVKRETLKRKTKHSHNKNVETDSGNLLNNHEGEDDFKDEEQNHRLNRKIKRKRQK